MKCCLEITPACLGRIDCLHALVIPGTTATVHIRLLVIKKIKCLLVTENGLPQPTASSLLRVLPFHTKNFGQSPQMWVGSQSRSLRRTLAPSLHRHTQLDGRFFTILSMYNSTYRFKAGWFLIFIMLGVSTSDSARWVTLSALKVSALRVLKTLRK